MAEKEMVKQELFVKHGRYFRQYPLSYVELKDLSTGEVIGAGLAPDGDMVYQMGAFKIVDNIFTEFPNYGYDFFERVDCATKILGENEPRPGR